MNEYDNYSGLIDDWKSESPNSLKCLTRGWWERNVQSCCSGLDSATHYDITKEQVSYDTCHTPTGFSPFGFITFFAVGSVKPACSR